MNRNQFTLMHIYMYVCIRVLEGVEIIHYQGAT